jgi:hypothetical protein
MGDDVTTVPFTPEDTPPGVTVQQNQHETNVTIDPTTTEKTQDEKDHEAAMIAKAEKGTATSSDDGQELFAGKYKTKEDFDKAIVEAWHKKHGDKSEDAFKKFTGDLSSDANDTPDVQTDNADTGDNTDGTDTDDSAADNDSDSNRGDDTGDINESMDDFVKEFVDDGTISEASYEKLAKAGYEKATVDTYMRGIESQRDSLFNRAGGKEVFFQMTEWAAEGEGMSKADIQLFNDDLNSNNMARMERAVDMLKAKYTTAGQTPAPSKRIQPENVNASTGVTGYTHLDQFKADQANPLYKKSAAFRAEVKEKLRLGSI